MNFYSDPYFMEDLLVTLVPALISGVPSCLFSIVCYVLSSLALYTLASRRGIRKAWLSWIPVLNVWIWGSLSDQYRYVVKGQIKSKRKILLILNLINLVMGLIVTGLMTFVVVQAVIEIVGGNSNNMILNLITGPVIAAAGFGILMAGVGIAVLVIRYVALYDIYTSMDPGNNVLFLVLSIIFSVTEPFFLFFNRNKDLGMPPRKPRQEPPVQPEQQPVGQLSELQEACETQELQQEEPADM